MNYEQLETDIVARITSKVPAGVAVVPLPEKQADQQKPFENARITVCYKGSDADVGDRPTLRSTAQVSQLETLQVEIVIQSRFLRTNEDSCLKLLSTVKAALLGFKPTDCYRMYMRRQQFLPNDQEPGDIFTFVTSFETTTLAVEEFDETSENITPAGQGITSITLSDPAYGDTVVQS